FTVDPVAQRSDRMLVEVVEGLGESLVSGSGGGMVYRVQHDAFRVVDVEGEGTGLDEERLEAVWRTARGIEAHFGGPQDVEFGFVGSELAVLQTRPITTLAPELVEPLDPVRKPTWPERAVLPLAAEHYTSAPKPLDNLVFTRLVGGAVEALRRAGGRVWAEDERAWRDQIWRQAYRLPRHRLTWRFLLAGRQQMRILEEDWTGWWTAGPESSLREVSRPVELRAMSDRDLFARADAILDIWEKLLGDRMFVASAFRSEAALRALVTLAIGRRGRAQVMADLGRGLKTPVTESNQALWRLARQARENPLLLSLVRDRTPKGMERSVEGRAFLEAVEDFLTLYGHREGSSWYLSTPTWHRNPAQVWNLLASLVELDGPSWDPDRATRSYQAAKERVERRLRPIPWLRRRFLTLLEGIRALTVFREQSHFDLTRPLSALQEIAGEWGRRLVDRGVLADEDSLFFLTPEEVRDWLLASPPTREAADGILARRRATFQVVNTTWLEELRSRRPGATLDMRGIPTSPGIARGPVRVVRGEHQFHRLKPGDILVCNHTNPSWTPLFSLAAGVVTEVGGPGSHAAIVAREYAIPCVMAVPAATETLRDGDQVVVDGGRGSVSSLTPGDRPFLRHLP
ncbi:PEP-utilizing enzyme, partial [Gemmatimonadota bacterium]